MLRNVDPISVHKAGGYPHPALNTTRDTAPLDKKIEAQLSLYYEVSIIM